MNRIDFIRRRASTVFGGVFLTAVALAFIGRALHVNVVDFVVGALVGVAMAATVVRFWPSSAFVANLRNFVRYHRREA